jgi:ABC-2 type transport system permease protein
VSALRDGVRMEVVRLATVRSTYALLGTAVGLGALIIVLLGGFSGPGALSGEATTDALAVGGSAAPLSVIGLVCGLLGVTAVSHDYRYRLVRAVLTAQPRRGTLIAARLAVLGVLAAAAAITATLIGTAGCVALGRRPLLDATTLRVVAVHVAVVVGWAWLGAALTWIVRNAIGVVALLLLGPLLIEPVLLLSTSVAGDRTGPLASVTPWLPFSAARQALGRDLASDGAVLGALPAAVDFAATVLVVVGLAWLVLRRRDA